LLNGNNRDIVLRRKSWDLEVIPLRKRGRTSAAEMGVQPVGIDAKSRPEPPSSLSPSEKATWREIVSSLRADWFEPENLPLLAEYIRYATLSSRLARELRGIEVLDPRFAPLFRQKMAVGNSLLRLATKLRLTLQSSTTARTDKHAGPRPLPWPGNSEPFKGWR
jgi:hypothetical protein